MDLASQRGGARRIRIWAEGAHTDAKWYAVKDSDTWTAPAEGYRSPQPEMFTYTFNR